jgi:large subunit ribosomal protein L17
MRHRKSGRKLGRTSSHRKAMWSNMVASLVTHGRIETTEAKAKEVRSIADKTITWGVSVHELIAKGTDKLSQDEKAKVVHAYRMAGRIVKDAAALDRLFTQLGAHFATRPGGYTRILKTRIRKGDAAPMAFVELVGVARAGAAVES